MNSMVSMGNMNDQFENMPTRYDLYYFRWNTQLKSTNINYYVENALETGVIIDQDAENYYYYILIAFIEGAVWDADCDYDILTDYDQPRVLSKSKKHIIDYRGKKFSSKVIRKQRFKNSLGYDDNCRHPCLNIEPEEDFINDEEEDYSDANIININLNNQIRYQKPIN
jgi:hypothetical protein